MFTLLLWSYFVVFLWVDVSAHTETLYLNQQQNLLHRFLKSLAHVSCAVGVAGIVSAVRKARGLPLL